MRRVVTALVLGGVLAVLSSCVPTRESLVAGRIGCPPNEITISDEASDIGWAESTETWVAECRGRRFICTKASHAANGMVGSKPLFVSTSDVECSPEVGSVPATASAPTPAAEPAKPTAPKASPPTGGAGFEFGADLATARAACEGAGEQFETDGEKSATCTGPVTPLGFAVRMGLKLCGEKVCAIIAEHHPETDWLGTIVELRSKLETKYGPPSVRDGEIQLECRSKEAFVGCLKRRQVSLRYGWKWSSGQSITLTVGVPNEEREPALRLHWAKPLRAVAVNDSAL
jgi:hypothetical protein